MNWLEEIRKDIISLFYSSLDKRHSSSGIDQLFENDYATLLVNLKDDLDNIFNG